eukprot:292513-Alexandrium_andersonii.AAC.1
MCIRDRFNLICDHVIADESLGRDGEDRKRRDSDHRTRGRVPPCVERSLLRTRGGAPADLVGRLNRILGE